MLAVCCDSDVSCFFIMFVVFVVSHRDEKQKKTTKRGDAGKGNVV